MSVDMSSQAITTRLRCVSDLRRVCRALSVRVPPTEVREGETGYAARPHSRTETRPRCEADGIPCADGD
jgi:hypothetical protein